MPGGPHARVFPYSVLGKMQTAEMNLYFYTGVLSMKSVLCFFVMENVSGMQGKRGNAILSELITHMDSIGYVVHRKLLNAEDYGIPQRRKRIILIGERNDIGSGYEFPKPIGEKHTVREAIGYLPPPPDD